MDLDIEISKAAFAIRLMERAIHDPASWTLTWGSMRTDARREVEADGVLITGTFESQCCHLVRPEPVVNIWSGGDLVASKLLTEDPGDGGFTFDLRLSVTHGAGVSA